LGRWGSGEQVAKAVLYLVDADFVTGEVLVVDGGERYGPGRYRFKDPDKEEKESIN
jgi:NAD(P)-dependent dehydrogenase (short-subunit alcohol dehydrogenase family)